MLCVCQASVSPEIQSLALLRVKCISDKLVFIYTYIYVSLMERTEGDAESYGDHHGQFCCT